MEHGALWQDHGLVFPSGIGTPFLGGNLNRAFKAMLRRAELPKSTRFHDLRHTCATLLLEAGRQPEVRAGLLGHADISLPSTSIRTCYQTSETPPGARWTPRSDRRCSRWYQSGIKEPRRNAEALLFFCDLQVIQERAWKDSNLRLAV